MKHLIEIALILIFLASCKNESASTVQTQKAESSHSELELSYFEKVTVSEILKLIKKNGLTIHESNPPPIANSFFSDFYRKKDGIYESDIHVHGLNDNLGVVTVIVRNFKQNGSKSKMEEMFNTLLSDIPKDILPPNVKGPNFVKSLSENIEVAENNKSMYRQTINGIDYTFWLIEGEISIDIRKEGN